MIAARRRVRQAAVIALALLVAAVCWATGGGGDAERSLQLLRDRIRTHPATGRIALVEIDARSLKELDRWPWPRGLHARAVDAADRAGASMIAFDADFSARSDPRQDRLFGAAIARSRAPVVLPTFRQPLSDGSRSVAENLPIAGLRRDALLASVNIFADHDGFVRRYPYSVVTGGVPRPPLGAILAGASGRSGDSFAMDGALDPASVPHVGFADFVAGRVDPRAIRGRALLIGATAIEMGDRYPAPRHGVIPGALIQLLAAETLLQGASPVDHGPLAAVAIVVAALAVDHRRRTRTRGALLGGASIAVLALAMRPARVGTIVALRAGTYSDVAGVMGAVRAAELIGRIAECLAVAGGTAIHRVGSGALAWIDAGLAEEQADRIDAAAALLRAPFEIAGRRIDLDCAFGLAPAADDHAIDHARMAADRALAAGARWRWHSADATDEREWRLTLSGELDRAMAAGDIWVAYQPKWDIAAGRIAGVEALVRWRLPTRGAIAPDAFIPALEESGRILDLTLFVLDRVLANRRRWREAGFPIGVAINVSALLPTDPAFAAQIAAIAADDLAALDGLTMEVTESAALTDVDAAIAALERIAALGIALSIDDYGTGQSTLSYLKRLPAREIKIDKGFVQALETSRGDQAMVRSTIELAHELGFKVVAEGVETAGALAMLARYGCDVAQGWQIGKPMASDDLLSLLAVPERAAA